MQLGVVLPVVYVREADDFAQPSRLVGRAGIGDLRVSAELPIARGDTALALSLVTAFPTGDGAHLLGAQGISAAPALVLRQRIADAALSLALGYRLRERAVLLGLEQDDELDAALGFALPLWRALSARAELRARVGIGGETAHRNENPTEADLAAAWAPDSPTLAAGRAPARACGRAAAATARRLGGCSSRCAMRSRRAACPYGPEDEDGYRDDDFCRDPDNDGDGIDDDADACPNDAEDRDGFEDGDGCPDTDNDADGLADTADACPNRSEDRDGFEDDDGCPEPDNDEDLVPDARDACPMDPEDRDGFEDDDGCPEPGPKPVSISVAESRILVSERIYFDYDRDTIRAVSTPVLDELAGVIRGLAAGTKVVVEGHTDDSGNAAYNLDLSHRRARAVVEYLHARGVPAERLDYVGYGGRARSVRTTAPRDARSTGASSSCWCAKRCVLCKGRRGGNHSGRGGVEGRTGCVRGCGSRLAFVSRFGLQAVELAHGIAAEADTDDDFGGFDSGMGRPCGYGLPCNPKDLGGHTCESLGLNAGELSCDPKTCNFVLTKCDGYAPDGGAGSGGATGSTSTGSPTDMGVPGGNVPGLFGTTGGAGGAAAPVLFGAGFFGAYRRRWRGVLRRAAAAAWATMKTVARTTLATIPVSSVRASSVAATTTSRARRGARIAPLALGARRLRGATARRRRTCRLKQLSVAVDAQRPTLKHCYDEALESHAVQERHADRGRAAHRAERPRDLGRARRRARLAGHGEVPAHRDQTLAVSTGQGPDRDQLAADFPPRGQRPRPRPRDAEEAPAGRRAAEVRTNAQEGGKTGKLNYLVCTSRLPDFLWNFLCLRTESDATCGLRSAPLLRVFDLPAVRFARRTGRADDRRRAWWRGCRRPRSGLRGARAGCSACARRPRAARPTTPAPCDRW